MTQRSCAQQPALGNFRHGLALASGLSAKRSKHGRFKAKGDGPATGGFASGSLPCAAVRNHARAAVEQIRVGNLSRVGAIEGCVGPLGEHAQTGLPPRRNGVGADFSEGFADEFGHGSGFFRGGWRVGRR